MNKNIEYRAWSATMKFVLLVFLVTTGLLIAKFLDAGNWVTVTISIVGGWVARDAATKFSEAYRDKQ